MTKLIKPIRGDKLKELVKRDNIKVTKFYDNDSCFSSKDVTIGGIAINEISTISVKDKRWQGLRSMGGPDSPDYRKQLALWKKITSEIDGVFCYYCKAQGFRTDHPCIAVCGACPGWYFYYREEVEEEKEEKKEVLVKDVTGNIVKQKVNA